MQGGREGVRADGKRRRNGPGSRAAKLRRTRVTRNAGGTNPNKPEQPRKRSWAPTEWLTPILDIEAESYFLLRRW